jgi:hypothetical protein
MITALLEWDGKQNIVSIRDDAAVIDIPLEAFLKLPAVRYVIAVAVEQADLLPSAHPLASRHRQDRICE